MSTSGNPQPGIAIHLNCPHCHSPIELVADGLAEEILCPSCGSSFRLDPDRTRSWSKDTLPTLGKFELLEPAGRGAFGTVYRARDTQLERIVAIKVPRSGHLATEEDEDRFVREARNAAQLQHPGIVPVYEVGRGAVCPYIVCEFVDGTTLADALTARRFDFRESARLVSQVAEALQHAHDHGVVHRDLKPSNIMLTTDGVPRVMDFGLAKRDAGEVTMTVEGQVLGTPAYMSPEQASGQAHHVDGRSDVYSLGVILFELLTGELPFRGNQRMLLQQVLRNEPRAPRSLNDRIPRDLETICQRAMAKEPGRRYQTARALSADLDRYLSGQSIIARPVWRIERGWRWCKRNPLVAGLSAAVALVLILGTIVSAYFAADALAQKRLADRRTEEALTNAENARKAGARADEKAQEALANAKAARDAEAIAKEKTQDALVSAAAEAQARSKADEETKRAQVEAEKATRVAQFLARMFEASAPQVHAGFRFTGIGRRASKDSKDPTILAARELLDRGARKVVDELKDQPDVQAALMDTIGNVYIGLGLTEQAGPLLNTALEIRRRLHSAPNLDTAASLYSLAVLHSMQLRLAESAGAAREAWTIRRELLGPEDKDTVDAKFMLAFAMAWGTYNEETETLMEEVLAWRRGHLTNGDPETAFALIGLAGILLHRGDLNRAASLLSEATAALKKDPATSLVGTALAETQQARVMWGLGKYQAAAELTTKAVDHFRESEADHHPLFAFVADLHVAALIHANRLNDAKSFCLQFIESLVEQGGPRTPFVFVGKCELLRVLARIHDPRDQKEIELLIEECVAASGGFSVELIDELVAAMRQVGGSLEHEDPQRADALFREAIEMSRRSLARQQESKANGKLDAQQYALAVMHLGLVLERRGNIQQAEDLYRQGLPVVRQHKDEFYAMQLTRSLAQLMRKIGQLDDAERWYRDASDLADELCRSNAKSGGPWCASILCDFGDLLSARGKRSEAAVTFQRAAALVDKTWATHARQRLSALESRQHEADEATRMDQQPLPEKLEELAVATMRRARMFQDAATYCKSAELFSRACTAWREIERTRPLQPEESKSVAESHLGMAQSLAATGIHRDAISQFENSMSRFVQCVHNEPDNASLTGRMDEAIAGFVNSSTSLLNDKHQGLTAALDFLSAHAAEISNALPIQDKRAWLFNELGNYYKQQRKAPEAIQAHSAGITILQTVLTTHPNDARTKITLAGLICNRALNFRDEQHEERRSAFAHAVELLNESLTLTPSDERAMRFLSINSMNLIDELIALHDLEACRSTCANLFKRAADTSDPWTAYRMAFGAALIPDSGVAPDRLVEAATRATKSDAPDKNWWVALGMAHYRASQYAEALKAFENSRQPSKNQDTDPVPLAFRAMALLRDGKRKMADKQWAEASALAERLSAEKEQARWQLIHREFAPEFENSDPPEEHTPDSPALNHN